MPELRRKNKR